MKATRYRRLIDRLFRIDTLCRGIVASKRSLAELAEPVQGADGEVNLRAGGDRDRVPATEEWLGRGVRLSAAPASVTDAIRDDTGRILDDDGAENAIRSSWDRRTGWSSGPGEVPRLAHLFTLVEKRKAGKVDVEAYLTDLLA